MWDQTDGCENQHLCASAIYLLSCIALEFSIIVDRAVGAPGHVKDVVDGLNYRDKRMLTLSMERLLNPKLIRDVPNISSSCRLTNTNNIKLKF